MAEALYRKYRPSTFEDVVGQEHIERTLKNALEQSKVSHAYLFCGPRGTGKTTMARILAKALLCEKAPTTEPDGTCEECAAIAAGTHPDVYELDAASRTGVENVREEIINRVHYAPTHGSYKIYIIDEVHMLSTAAFNALLKTLEEPPSHVVFILCTTDPQKVPDTIHSRCQRFDFHRLSVDEIVARLGAVCVQEEVEFEPEALELIAHQAEGGMRNALTSLEQLAAFGEGRVTLDGAHRILGSLDNEGLTEIVQALGRHDAGACFTWVSHYVETGADIAQFVQELAEHMRNLYLMSLTNADVEIPASSSAREVMESELELFGTERLSRALSVLGDLMKELRATTNSRLAFEIALTRLLRPESDLTLESLAERIEELEMKQLSVPVYGAAQGVAAPQGAPAAPAPSFAQAPVSAANPYGAVQMPVNSVPAPQQAPAPQPAPAPQAVPAPQPTPAPQSIPTPQPEPAVPTMPTSQSAPSAASAPVSPVQAPSAASNAAVDLQNAAALQRMWHSVMTALRKANPARGFLFMGSKIEADPQNQGVKIVFTPELSVAYDVAQKKEVKDALTQSFIEVTGNPVPFQLVMMEGAGRAASSGYHNQAPQNNPVPTPNIPSTPAQPAANMAPTVASSIPQAAAPAAPVPSAPSAPSTPAPASAMPRATPSPDQSMPQAAPSPVYATQTDPASSGMMGRYEDESPFFDDDPSAGYVAPEPRAPQVPQVSQAAEQQVATAPAAPAPVTSPAPTQPQPSSPQNVAPSPAQPAVPQPQPAAAQPQSAAPQNGGELSEADLTRQILTATFGEDLSITTEN